MRGITFSRVPALVFGFCVASTLAFGVTSAVAAPEQDRAGQYFCGFYDSWEGCVQCCGGDVPPSWEGIECYCNSDVRM